MFKSLKVVVTIACLLYGSAAVRVACAQSFSEFGSLSSPTPNIYFSSPIAVTTTGALVSISGTPLAPVFGVFYGFWIAVQYNGKQPWVSGSNALASNYAYVGTVYLDNTGTWTQPGDLSAYDYPSMGSSTASCWEQIYLGAVFTPPSSWGGTSGGVGFSSTTFDYY
jgi:hypothetical protein